MFNRMESPRVDGWRVRRRGEPAGSATIACRREYQRVGRARRSKHPSRQCCSTGDWRCVLAFAGACRQAKPGAGVVGTWQFDANRNTLPVDADTCCVGRLPFAVRQSRSGTRPRTASTLQRARVGIRHAGKRGANRWNRACRGRLSWVRCASRHAARRRSRSDAQCARAAAVGGRGARLRLPPKTGPGPGERPGPNPPPRLSGARRADVVTACGR
jgi:hypothetical protein